MGQIKNIKLHIVTDIKKKVSSMASAVDTEQIRNITDCSICLQKIVNAKILVCNHHFCKDCLESLLSFRQNGSATITCPLEDCAHETIINVNETVNDLPTYEVEDTVETVESSGEGLDSETPICTYIETCVNPICLYCCGQRLCKSCSVNHENALPEHKGRMSVFFCKKGNTIKGLCEEHFSTFTHLCCDNIFLCVYCLHRNKEHKEHTKNTIESEAELIKEALIQDYNNMVKIEEFRKATEANIPIVMERLDAALKARREECLAQYLAYLNAEEEKIKDKFEDICGHVRQIAELSLQEDGL